MCRHLAYLRYVLRHKWFVLVAGIALGVPLWRLLVHDLSKFRPSEWFPYARCFYNPDGTGRYDQSFAFAVAWNAHQKRNPHHWQYWILTWDNGGSDLLPMPDACLRELLADWMGASRAIHGKSSPREWYAQNRDRIKLSPSTRKDLEKMMEAIH
jgi:hypothetical protein